MVRIKAPEHQFRSEGRLLIEDVDFSVDMFCFVDNLAVCADDSKVAATASRQRHGNVAFGGYTVATTA